MPYISLVPGKNCQQNRCQKPYSFQHQMSLSSNAELFKQRVRNAPISGNIDNPEGGFDALMQVFESNNAMFEQFSSDYIFYNSILTFELNSLSRSWCVMMKSDGGKMSGG